MSNISNNDSNQISQSSFFENPENLSSEVDIRDFLEVIFRRWWVPAIIAFVAGTYMYLEARSEPPVYTAEVILQRKETSRELGQIGMGLGTGATPEAVSTQMEILRSRSVVAAVIDSLRLGINVDPLHVPRSLFMDFIQVDANALPGEYILEFEGDRLVMSLVDEEIVVGELTPEGILEGPGFLIHLTDLGEPLRGREDNLTFTVSPREDLIPDFTDALIIEHVGGTNLIRAQYTSPDPELAAAVVNSLAQSYQVFSGLRARSEAMRRREFLATQLAQLADSMAAAQQQLSEFQENSGTLNPVIEVQTLGDALLEEEGNLRNLLFDHTILRNVVRSLESGDESNTVYEKMLTLGTAVNMANDMYGRLQMLEDERRRLTDSRFGLTSNSPEVEPLDSMILAVKMEMRSVMKNSLILLEDRIENSEERVAQLRADVGELPERAASFTKFQQRVDQVRNIFDMLAEKYYEAQIGESIATGDVELVDFAPIPVRPDPAHHTRNILFAVIFGFLVGVGLALLMEHLDPRLRDPRAVERASKLKVLAIIPRLEATNGNKDQRVVARVSPLTKGDTSGRNQWLGAEAFRMLRTIIRFTQEDDGQKGVFTVTSSQPSEGKTTVTVNLASSMAYQGNRVLILDGDMRRPKIHLAFGLDRGPGLSELLRGQAQLSDITNDPIVSRIDGSDLYVITAGSAVDNPAELLGNTSFNELIAHASSKGFTVIIDSPPTLAFADAALIGSAAQGVLVVVRSHVSVEPALASSVNRLKQLDVPLMGVVLNDARKGGLNYYGYYGYYGYGYYGYGYSDYYSNSDEDEQNIGGIRGLLSKLKRSKSA
tara:strand:+ start:1298 stop:3781 length:2484 start_codon:yes stop_codon:yes gene_type:complete